MESTSPSDSNGSAYAVYNLSQGTTEGLSVKPPSSWNASQVVFYAFCCILAVSFVANLLFLISLLMSRQARQRTYNVFICNQTILDLVATSFAAMDVSLKLSGYLRTKTGTGRMLVCLIIESDAMGSSVIYGSVYGLVIITLERYAKIVHPVVHRNRYRRWMTYVGVAIPWIVGVVTSAIPALTTTQFGGGTCRFLVYPSMAAACVARVALFSWRFIVPLVIFALCYWKIIKALRRGPKVGTSHPEQPEVAGPSTSRAAPSTSTGGHPKPMDKSQKKVVKTMIAVITSFFICWMPLQLMAVFIMCIPGTPIIAPLIELFALISTVNLCADPFIYASGQYQLLRAKCIDKLRAVVRRENRVGVEVVPMGTASGRPAATRADKITTKM